MENTLPSSNFTFIANYKGGIFIRQVNAEDLSSASYTWAEQLSDMQDIPELNANKFLQAFKEDMEDLPPQPLRDTPNVWAFSVGSSREFMLVNIVKTVESAEYSAHTPDSVVVK